ncbi:NADH-quinone oxidoreductase subunit N [Actinocorallia longicatena]|uniref:NADH-quinone oxidoreductase subunit N n=1 Tax=Actinocorallia longicatena TaxID=111803 RepID=A0ABP6QJV2_9ACTN
MIQSIDYAALSPLIVISAGAIALLLGDLFDASRRVLGWAAAGILAAAFGAVLVLAAGDPRATFCVPGELRGDGPPSCSYVADDFTLVFQGIVLAAAFVVVLLSLEEIERTSLPAGEYFFLLFCAVAGVLSLVAARDLVLLVVGLETLSLPVFALVALRRYDGRATEAAVKLFLVSVVSAAVLLFGISLVYGTTGSMHFDRIAIANVPDGLEPVLAAGIVMVIVGFGFKVAAVPFHFWAPDVYQGAPLPVAAFLSVVSKAGGFAGLALVVTLAFPQQSDVWGPLLAVLAAVTMTAGNVMALRQTQAVRLLAWSSVAQSGYMIAPLAVGVFHIREAVAATAGYLAFYAVMNLGAFAIVTGFRARQGAGEADLLADYRGMARVTPWYGGALAFFLVCLAGLPPGIMGLLAKVLVFKAVLSEPVAWLGVVMAVNTAIGLYYYLRWAVRLFGPAPAERYDLPWEPSFKVAVALTAGAAVLLSVAPQLLLEATLSLG